MFTNRDLRKLIVPLIIEQILAISVGMIDTMMISSAGEAAMSGVSLVDMLNNLLINVFAALSTGGAVVASQYLGHKDDDKACESAGQLMIVTFLFAAGIMILSIVGRRGLLHLIYGEIEEEVMENALVYLFLSALSYPFLALYNASAALFRSMGNSKVSMKTSVLMNLINCIGNAILIFGFKWGVAGAAIATLFSRMVACAIMMRLILDVHLPVHVTVKGLRWNGKMIKQILHIGIPSGIENSIFQLGRVLVVSMIAGFGTVQIAANAVANNLDGMGCIPGQAMNLAMITVVGQCVGAGDFDEAERYAKKMLKLTYLIGGICNITILLSMPLVLQVYDLSPETMKLASTLVWIHDGCAIFLWPSAFTLTNVFRAANDVKFPMCISIFSMWTFRVALSYVLAVRMGMGAIGVWSAMIVDWIFRASCFLYRFFSGKWKLYYKAA